MPKKCLWLAVTPDKYELPLLVEETAKELAIKLGMNTCAVQTAVAMNRSGVKTGRKLIKIEV